MDGDVNVPYKANAGTHIANISVDPPPDLEEIQGQPSAGSEIGMTAVPHDVARRIACRDAWSCITNIVEHDRFRGAIVQSRTGYKLNSRVVN